MAGLEHYMTQYDHEHHSVWNKVLHGIGIPLIFAGLILLVLLRWRWGVGITRSRAQPTSYRGKVRAFVERGSSETNLLTVLFCAESSGSMN